MMLVELDTVLYIRELKINSCEKLRIERSRSFRNKTQALHVSEMECVSLSDAIRKKHLSNTLLSNTALSTGMSGMHVQLCLFNYT